VSGPEKEPKVDKTFFKFRTIVAYAGIDDAALTGSRSRIGTKSRSQQHFPAPAPYRAFCRSRKNAS